MNILILTDFEGSEGGVEVFDSFIQEKLSEGNNVKTFSRPKDRPMKTKFYDKQDLKDFKGILKNFQPDIVFVHSIGKNISPLVLREASKNSKVVMKLPDILTYQKASILEGKFLFVRPIWTRVLRYSLRKYVDFFVPPSKNSEKWLIEDLGVDENRIRTIMNPVLYDLAEEPKIPENDKILFVGRLHESKGVETLINAFSSLEKKEVELLIVGDGPQKHEYEEMVKEKEISEKVNFVGKIDHEEVKEYYHNSTVFVLPSIVEENSPLTIPEAMSQGTPVITTEIGGQKELVEEGKTGLYFETENSEDLIGTLTELLNNRDLLEEMSNNSLDYSKGNTPRKHVEELERVFEKVARG